MLNEESFIASYAPADRYRIVFVSSGKLGSDFAMATKASERTSPNT
jgi:hypothetical protein